MIDLDDQECRTHYVICPVAITSPAPPEGFTRAFGLGPNHPCGLHVDVPSGYVEHLRAHPDEICCLLCRCPRGHRFYAPRAIHEKADDDD